MSNILKWSLKKAVIAFAAIFCALVVLCAFLAPLTAKTELNSVSTALYNFLHKLCSVHALTVFLIKGQPVGLCARCMGAYITATITLYGYLHKFKINKVVYIILGALSLGEIAAEYFNFFVTNDFIMLVCGLILGIFLATSFVKILDWLEGKKGW